MIVRTLPTAQSVAVEAAEHVARALHDYNGPATLGLAGGSTPQAMYGQLAGHPLAWEEITMWLGDERWVAHEHPESNVGMVREALVDRVNGQLLAPNHLIGDPHDAAAAYEKSLSSAFIDRGSGPVPDVVLLGIGDDGHTASLFPDTDALENMSDRYVANWVASKDAWRLTSTFPLLWSARQLIFLVTGSNKADVLREILVEDVPHPAQRVAGGSSNVTWFLDEPAATRL